MLTAWHEIVRRRELLYLLVARNLKIRYKNSALGFLWTLLGPLFLILIYAVFLGLLKVPIELPVLVTGIIVWQFLAMCLGDSLQAILGNANLVTKAAFPRIMLPGAMVVANGVNFALSMAVLLVYLVAARAEFGCVLLLPLVVATHVALCLGAALIVATANVFFRDTEHILHVVMLAWFFMTPVVYQVSLVAGQYSVAVDFLFFLNPMTGIVAAYRMLLLSRDAASAGFLAISFGVAWLTLAVGLWVFRKAQFRFGDEL